MFHCKTAMTTSLSYHLLPVFTVGKFSWQAEVKYEPWFTYDYWFSLSLCSAPTDPFGSLWQKLVMPGGVMLAVPGSAVDNVDDQVTFPYRVPPNRSMVGGLL